MSLYKALGLEARPVVLGVSVRRGLNEWLPLPIRSCDRTTASRPHAELYSITERVHVPVDYAEAAKWLRKAADQNNAGAENAVGWMYENGYGGLKKDPALAVQWYRKSADQSNMTADPSAPVPTAVESDCADGQQLCRDGSFLCGVYRRDFLADGRICPGVTDVTKQ